MHSLTHISNVRPPFSLPASGDRLVDLGVQTPKQGLLWGHGQATTGDTQRRGCWRAMGEGSRASKGAGLEGTEELNGIGSCVDIGDLAKVNL